MELLRDFCRRFPGRRVLVRLIALSKEQTAAQRGYYYGYILPEINAARAEQGTVETEAETDAFLRGECPLCWRDGECQTVVELDSEDMSKFIDWLKWYAAENFQVYVEDSNLIV
jgi:hypothetical protein